MNKNNLKKQVKKNVSKTLKDTKKAVKNFDSKKTKKRIALAADNFDGHIRHNAHNYAPQTGAYLRREWRGPKDTLVDYKFWLKNWAVAGVIFSKAPKEIIEASQRYRWVWSLLECVQMFDHGKEGLRGTALKVANLNYSALNMCVFGGLYGQITADPEKTVLLEMTQFGTLLKGFDGIGSIAPASLSAYVMSTTDAQGAIPYLDAAQAYGIPADVCPLPETGAGLAILDDFNTGACCGLATNMPCDGGIMSSVVIDKRTNIPMYPLFTPVRYKYEEAIEYFVKDFRGAIAFLEENLGQEFSFEKMKPSLETLNEQNLLLVEKFDCNKGDYPQYLGTWGWMYRMLTLSITNPKFTAIDQKVVDLMRTAVKNQEKLHPQQRFRALVWGAPCNYYANLQNWLLNCWGIVTVYSMLGDSGALEAFPLNTEDEMLTCLAENVVRNSMRKQTNGGYENIMDELWDLCDEYKVDIVFLQDHINCKGMDGILTMLEEQADERGIKLCTVPQDLMDPRVINRMEMRDKINKFMYNVMGVEPIAPELVNFDDTHGH